jgi:thiol-disulfide isomerase/thioredoxin
LQDTVEKVKDNEKIQALIDKFNSHENTKKIEALITRLGESYQNEYITLYLRDNLALLDSVGSNQTLRDIYIARDLYTRINVMHKSLEPAYIKYAEDNIKMPYALEQVKTLNDKYVAIEKMDMSKLAKLNKGSELEGMSDGEKMLRKLCEPYKGKFILLDVWGTWCGPCKKLLSHSQEEYERLKDFDLVYLYLCNDSSDESWQNVIKEYNVVGPNVVHYNLPKEQQSAIEHYLNVHSFPTYKLIDREGNVLDLDVSAHDLEGLAKLLEKIK